MPCKPLNYYNDLAKQVNQFLYDTEKNLAITLPVQNLLKDFDFDAGVTVRVEVDVFVEQLDVELGLGAAVHALGGNLHPFLQAVHHSFLVTQLQKEE